MPSNLVKTQRDEHLWNKAKAIVRKEYELASGDRFYQLVNGIYQNMKGGKKHAEIGYKINRYIEKIARELTREGRAKIKTKNFGLPDKAKSTLAKKESGNYPIHDIEHARSALRYGARFLSSSDYAKLKNKVYKKYPSLGE